MEIRENEIEQNMEEIQEIEMEQMYTYKNLYMCVSQLVSEFGRESIKEYIKDNNIRKIIIYGASVAGRILFDILNSIEECQVLGVVDKGGTTEYGFHEFIPIEELKNIQYDLIVVTPLNVYRAIYKDLEKMNIDKYCFVSELVDYKGRKMIYENGISF